jgi:hypothetical protein
VKDHNGAISASSANARAETPLATPGTPKDVRLFDSMKVGRPLADIWDSIWSKEDIFGALRGSSSHGVLIRLTIQAASIVLVR